MPASRSCGLQTYPAALTPCDYMHWRRCHGHLICCCEFGAMASGVLGCATNPLGYATRAHLEDLRLPRQHVTVANGMLLSGKRLVMLESSWGSRAYASATDRENAATATNCTAATCTMAAGCWSRAVATCTSQTWGQVSTNNAKEYSQQH